MNKIKTYGTIVFDVEDKTNKHKSQSSWKKTAFVLIGDDSCQYYSWFLKKRYNIILNQPLRLSHISFINDSMRDLTQNGEISEELALEYWEQCKQKWDGKEIQIVLDLNPKTDDRSWWLNIPQDERDLLHAIRAEVGLGRPHFGLHMSLGYANENNIYHSMYIHSLIKNGFIK
jgi:hypothetical protein